MPIRLSAAIAVLVMLSAVPALAQVQTGRASWYQCCNPVTACGVPFRPSTMGAAHRTWPCGTKVRVTLGARTILVTVLDRGPYSGGRIIDLYRGAAEQLGMIRRGVASVRVERLN